VRRPDAEARSADAREEVLGRVRAALEAPLRAARPDLASAGPVAPRAYRTAGEHAPGSPAALDLLVDRLVDYRASVVRCSSDDLPGAIAAALDGASVVVPAGVPGEWLGGVAGDVLRDEGVVPVSHGELDAIGAVLTGCRVAIALTGTIILDGAPDQGRRALTLLPDRHVCVVRAEQVVQTVPEAVDLLGEHPERPLTWISGPSATSDIELVRVEGVHGPRHLRVVLVER
jgi:L-lactate dehydrogenase complex protein LldG